MVFQPEPPPGVDVQQVACGRDFTVVLFENGEVWGCGHNFFFQLGIEHGQNAYYATHLSPVWSRYLPFAQSQRERERHALLGESEVVEDSSSGLEVMSMEDYSRRVRKGQERLDAILGMSCSRSLLDMR